MQLWRKHPSLLRMAALGLSAVVALLPTVLTPAGVTGIEEIVGDATWRWGSSSRAEKRIVLVDIDEKSLRAVGPWPWPRATVAELSTRLSAAGAAVQAYDIIFSDPRAGDDALVAAWTGAAAPVVAPQLFAIESGAASSTGVVSGALKSPGCPSFAPSAFGSYGLAPELLNARPTLGHITPRVDDDGVIRHVPALICHEGRAYATLALSTLWQLAQPAGTPAPGGNAPDWEWHLAGAGSPFPAGLAPAAWLSSRSLPGVTVPLDAQGNIRVPYALKREAFMAVSAVDVLRGSADPALLRGTVALVGATAFGMGDTVATPHGAVASGLEVHTQALVGMLDNRAVYTPALWPQFQLVVMAMLGALLLALASRRKGVPAKRLPLVGLLLSGGVVALASLALLNAGLWLPWLPLASFVLLASISLATVEHALTRAQRERLSAHLGAYLPAPVANRLMATEPSGQLQLEARTVSVLVADIRNFTALATHGQPDEVAALLHAFCCQAVDVVERHGGVVENVVGDSILAVWSASAGSDQQHAQHALKAAQELVRTTRQLLASRAPVAEHSLVQPLALGIGLETGVAIVGSFGPARRRAHAALGEPVSVAHRIQQMTADLSMPIIVGPQLAALLEPESTEPLGEYLLEGLAKHYQLYAPVGWSDLIAVDSHWATAAAGAPDRQAESTEWSRWGATSSPGWPPSHSSRLQQVLGRRGA
jgi:adenylate cyclase